MTFAVVEVEVEFAVTVEVALVAEGDGMRLLRDATAGMAAMVIIVALEQVN